MHITTPSQGFWNWAHFQGHNIWGNNHNAPFDHSVSSLLFLFWKLFQGENGDSNHHYLWMNCVLFKDGVYSLHSFISFWMWPREEDFSVTAPIITPPNPGIKVRLTPWGTSGNTEGTGYPRGTGMTSPCWSTMWKWFSIKSCNCAFMKGYFFSFCKILLRRYPGKKRTQYPCPDIRKRQL